MCLTATDYVRFEHVPASDEDRMVEFKLIYDGQLRPSKRKPTAVEKHDVRRQLHKQLKRLWEVKDHPLRGAVRELGGGVLLGSKVLAERFEMCGYNFVPLVTEDHPLCVSLDVLFLRRDKVSALYLRGGDIDSRLATLFDGLRKPDNCGELPLGAAPDEDEKPFYVLLQNDSLVVDLRVTTSMLLTPLRSNEAENDVHLVIGVQIKPSGE